MATFKNLICPICKTLIKDEEKTKEISYSCNMLQAHVTCIRKNYKTLKVANNRKTVIKIKFPKKD